MKHSAFNKDALLLNLLLIDLVSYVSNYSRLPWRGTQRRLQGRLLFRTLQRNGGIEEL
jgi:hypothetical protein